MLTWIGVCEIPHIEPLNHFIQHGIFYSGKRKKKVRYLIWLAVTWVIWGERNDVVFKGLMEHVFLIEL